MAISSDRTRGDGDGDGNGNGNGKEQWGWRRGERPKDLAWPLFHLLMDPREPSPRLRGAALLVARAAALVVSVGIVAALAAQAGLSGCSASEPTIQADVHSANSETPAEPPSASSTAGPASKPHYMPGPKAPAGRWAYPDDEPSAKPAAQAPSQGVR